MFTQEELRQQFEAYKDDRISRSEFRDWFESRAFDAYENRDLHDTCVAIDTAFSEYLFDNIGENSLKQELESAIRPFALPIQGANVLYRVDNTSVRQSATAISRRLVLRVGVHEFAYTKETKAGSAQKPERDRMRMGKALRSNPSNTDLAIWDQPMGGLLA